MAKKKILVVDDEVDFLELAKARLEANGYDVISTSNGNTVLDLIKKEKPDGVMLDIMMPDMDGLGILKAIRSGNPHLPVFLITAFSNEERRSIADKFNATGFILKTNDLQAELNSINTLIDGASKRKA
jgi:CheY-like chemotaxis protein